MHASLPYHFYVWIDNTHLGPNMPSGLTKGILHSVYSKPGQLMLTHVLLETGAHWSGLPLHLLTHKPTAEALCAVEPWGGMGTQITTTHFTYLDGLKGKTIKEKLHFRHTGIIIDWNDGFSKYPQEHKPLSLICLEQGNFGLLPNNYFKLCDKHFTDELEENNLNLKNYRRGETVYWENNSE